jgi:glycosyltransferase involved in cell wall biosynthesis
MVRRILSIVEFSSGIPAYGEETSIEYALYTLDEAWKSDTVEYEIVVVHNESNNETLSKAMTFTSKNGRVKGLSYTENVRREYAAETGFTLGNGDLVLAESDIDVDLTHVIFKPLRRVFEWVKIRWFP